jgi:Tfp pilus assembly protein PilO
MRVNRTTKQIYAGLGAVVLCIALGLWWSVARAGRLQEQIDKTEVQLGIARGHADELARLAREVTALRDQLGDASKTVPDREEMASVMRELSLQIDSQALADQGMSTLTARPSDDYVTLPVEITFGGDSQSVFDFVRRVEHMPQLMQFESLAVRSEQVDTGQVKSALRLNLYFCQTPEAQP